MGDEARRGVPRGVLKVGLFVVLVAVLIALRPVLFRALHSSGSSSDVGGKPIPQLFSAAAIRPVGSQVSPEGAQAAAAMDGWWKAEGTGRHDKAFAKWLKQTLPAPPDTATRTREAQALSSLAGSRTPTGLQQAAWLKQHGDAKVWSHYGNQAFAGLSSTDEAARKKELEALLKLTKKVSTSLKRHDAQSAPYVLDPSVAAKGQQTHSKSGGPCPCSYPAAPAASGAAATTWLGFLSPQDASTYLHMRDEVDYAHLYLASNLPSDLKAGTMLGDMVAEYFLVTRDHGTVDKVAAALRSA